MSRSLNINRFFNEKQEEFYLPSFALIVVIRGPFWGGYIYEINIMYPFYRGEITLLVEFMVSWIRIKKMD